MSGIRRHVVEELLVVRKLLVHDFGLDGFLNEVPGVGFTDQVLGRICESLDSCGASVDGSSVCTKPDGEILGVSS